MRREGCLRFDAGVFRLAAALISFGLARDPDDIHDFWKHNACGKELLCEVARFIAGALVISFDGMQGLDRFGFVRKKLQA